MPHAFDVDRKLPPFDQLRSIQRLDPERSGHASVEHVRHQLYVARDPHSRTDVLIKTTSKPGLIYQQNLVNEIASLTTINQALPDSRYFPFLQTHGRLRDGSVYLIMSLFDEYPLATAITAERVPARIVGYLMTTIEVARALARASSHRHRSRRSESDERPAPHGERPSSRSHRRLRVVLRESHAIQPARPTTRR